MTNLKLVTVAKRDGSTKSVMSPYNDSNIIARLRELAFSDGDNPAVLNSEFARDLCRKDVKYGLSPKQLAWAQILVVESETGPTSDASFPNIRKMLDKAADAGLKTPKVLIETTDGNPIRMGRAGLGSKNPGRIQITDGKSFGENTYYGYLDADGDFFSRSSATPDIVAALKEFDANPIEVAAAYGKRTGNCCFCTKELTTAKSTDAGYGPVCAKKFSLPWGGGEVQA